MENLFMSCVYMDLSVLSVSARSCQISEGGINHGGVN